MGYSTGADQARGDEDPEPVPGRRLPSGVGALWALLGIGATAVLSWLAFDMGGPDRVATALVDAAGPRSATAMLRAELRLALAEAQADHAAVSAAEIAENEALRRRIATLEGMLEAAGATGRLQAGGEALAPETTAAIPSGPAINFDAPPAKFDLPPKGEERAPTAPGAPGARNGAPDTVASVPVMAAPGAERSRLAPVVYFALDLGAYEDLEVMKERWNLIEGRHRDILGALQPRRITQFGADGRVAHRLVAGPIADAMLVAEMCAALRARAVPCRQTLSAGEPL